MTYTPTLIAPYKSGLSQYYKPFLIGNDAFITLDNCYSTRGLIKKRPGSTIFGRLPKWATATAISNASPPVVTSAGHGLATGDMVWIENAQNSLVTAITVGATTSITTNIAHNLTTNQFVNIFGTTGSIGAVLNPLIVPVTVTGANTFTINVNTLGKVYSGGGAVFSGLNNRVYQITRIDANNFSLQDLNTGVNIPSSAPATTADIYLPVMGLRTFIVTATGDEQLIAFHPKQAFIFNTGTQLFQNISFDTASAPILWTGTKDNFFYSSNFATVMWVTNNIDPVRYYNGSLTAGFADLTPTLDAGGTVLTTALIVIPYKGRLVLLNTTESTVNFPQRARWDQIGTPFVANPAPGFSTDTDAWKSDIFGKGGFVDADTSERIVSAEIIQDTLIVGFQFSTWRLRYTANEVLPFIWERIDTQYGSEGTFTTVAFDDACLQISRRGIVAATFNNVSRIDMTVPDIVESIEPGLVRSGFQLGFQRIQGIRDFDKRLVYWLYGTDGEQTPNKIICYNYQDTTWSTFTQSFTCLGRYKYSVDNTWQTWTSVWAGDNTPWNLGNDTINDLFIVAGDVKSNVWQIMNDEVGTDNGRNFNFTITTNIINPYFDQAKRCRLAYYDVYATTFDNCAVTVTNYTDDNDNSPWLQRVVNLNDTAGNVSYFRVFFGMIAKNHQIQITLSNSQLADVNIGSSPFEIQGIILHTRDEGRIKR